MGLDIIEFVMSVEERFGIEIPDGDAQRLTTPRLLVDYIMTKVKAGQDRGCLNQREFHRLRRALVARHWATRRDVKPDTLLEGIVPRLNRRTLWQQLGAELQSSRWPQLLRPKPVKAALIAAAIAAWFLPWILRGGDILRGDLTPVALSVFSTIGVTWAGLITTKRLQEVFPPVYATVGGVAQHLVGTRRQPEKVQEGWTREEVRETVRALIIEHLAVTDFTDDSRFVQDMHIE
ncbi:MAG TPA: acyl carrier protein [Terriglobia bacterium]|nr:acyl carrier protein [Terriglobia bacterium]